VVVSVLRAAARRRLVKTKNPRACVTVCCIACVLIVIKSGCVTKCK
jgi:hypothetical protein